MNGLKLANFLGQPCHFYAKVWGNVFGGVVGIVSHGAGLQLGATG
jgi:hypothetical protein